MIHCVFTFIQDEHPLLLPRFQHVGWFGQDGGRGVWGGPSGGLGQALQGQVGWGARPCLTPAAGAGAQVGCVGR